MKLAVQLYTLRRDYETPEEFVALFKKIKAIGFDGVEFAGFQGIEPTELKAALDEAGLKAVGCHASTESFDGEENIAKAIDTAKILGMTTYGTGGAPHSTREDIDRLRRIYKAANAAGAKEGINFYYHNHTEEFELDFDGKLCEECIAEEAYLQIDTYWSFLAGADNYKFITEHKDKIVHLHIKDGIGRDPKALGEGNCDLASVIKAAKDIGLEWIILENDDPSPTGIEDITRSMAFLKANI